MTARLAAIGWMFLAIGYACALDGRRDYAASAALLSIASVGLALCLEWRGFVLARREAVEMARRVDFAIALFPPRARGRSA